MTDEDSSGGTEHTSGATRDPSTVPDESGFLQIPRGVYEEIKSADAGPLLLVREFATSVGCLMLVGLMLLAVTGVWPPMVAVESGSMQPHMTRGDLVMITEPGRFASDAAYGSTGISTYRTAKGMGNRHFGSSGSVIVFQPPNRSGSPIIHRSRFWVEEGENWYEKGDLDYLDAESCSELRNCPAPNSGFVTKGDNNRVYDQAMGLSPPVKPEWVRGTAQGRIPYLGCVRLEFAGSGCIEGVPW